MDQDAGLQVLLKGAVKKNNLKRFQELIQEIKERNDPKLIAKLSSTDEFNETILQFAVEKQNVEMVDTLVKLGFDIFPKGLYGRMPIDIAIRDARYKNPAIAKILMKKYLELQKDKKIDHDINAYDFYGRTYLDYAIESGDPGLVKQLIEAGADVNKKSSKTTGHLKESPLYKAYGFLAAENGSYNYSSFRVEGTMKEIFVDLINHGANLREQYSYAVNQPPIGIHIALHVRLRDLPGLKPELEKELRAIQDICLLGHRAHLKGLMRYQGYRIELEGLTLGLASNAMLSSFQQYVDSNAKYLNEWMNKIQKTTHLDYFDPKQDPNNIIKIILKDLSKIDLPLSEKVALDLLNQHQIVPVPLLTSIRREGDHAQTYMFFDNFAMRINCGGTVDPRPGRHGITLYQIGDLNAIKKLLPQFINSNIVPITDEYLLNGFVKECQLRERDFIKLPAQTVGNCGWVSSLGLLRAIVLMAIYKAKVEKTDRYETEPKSGKMYWELCWEFAKKVSETLVQDFIDYDLKVAAESLIARGISSQTVPELTSNVDEWSLSPKKSSVLVDDQQYQALVYSILRQAEIQSLLKSMYFSNEAEKNSAIDALVAEQVGALNVQQNKGKIEIIFESTEKHDLIQKRIELAFKELQEKGKPTLPPGLFRIAPTKLRSVERAVPERLFHSMLKNTLLITHPKKRMAIILKEDLPKVGTTQTPMPASKRIALRSETFGPFGIEMIRRSDPHKYIVSFADPKAAIEFDKQLQEAQQTLKSKKVKPVKEPLPDYVLELNHKQLDKIFEKLYGSHSVLSTSMHEGRLTWSVDPEQRQRFLSDVNARSILPSDLGLYLIVFENTEDALKFQKQMFPKEQGEAYLIQYKDKKSADDFAKPPSPGSRKPSL